MKHLFSLTLMAALVLQEFLIAQPYGQLCAQAPNDNRPFTPQKAVERTLSIITPDAVKNRHIGDIISRFEDAGLHIAAIKMVQLSPEQVAQFYRIHRERPFFRDLVN